MHQKNDKREKTAEEKLMQDVTESVAESVEQQNEENSDEKEPQRPTDSVTMTKAEFLQVKEHIEKLKNEREELVNLAKRTQADFDNFRKRNASIYCESLEEGERGVIKELLPVLDNFERALQSNGEGDAWREGVRLVYKQFVNVLEKNGLAEIESTGQFDPEFHEAVLQEEAEGKAEGEIIEVLQKGYKVKNRIIRHSMVKVAK